MTKDEGAVDDTHPLLSPFQSHVEWFTVYVGTSKSDLVMPMDGSQVTTAMVGALPTSSGNIELASTDPTVTPVIDQIIFQ